MDYNLNFFPNNFDQNNLHNPYTPYSSMYGYNNINQQNLLDSKLKDLQNIQQNMFHNQFQQNNKGYYLFCGDKQDWDEFLSVNYGITEEAIFDDYKLFLQAKQELAEEQGKNKINNMKNRITGNRVVDSSIKSNVRPTEPQGIKQNDTTVRVNNNISNRDIVQPDNGLLGTGKESNVRKK